MKKFEDTSLEDLAISTRIFTHKACQNIVRQSFEYAKTIAKSVTVVEKPNVIRETNWS